MDDLLRFVTKQDVTEILAARALRIQSGALQASRLPLVALITPTGQLVEVATGRRFASGLRGITTCLHLPLTAASTASAKHAVVDPDEANEGWSGS